MSKIFVDEQSDQYQQGDKDQQDKNYDDTEKFVEWLDNQPTQNEDDKQIQHDDYITFRDPSNQCIIHTKKSHPSKPIFVNNDVNLSQPFELVDNRQQVVYRTPTEFQSALCFSQQPSIPANYNQNYAEQLEQQMNQQPNESQKEQEHQQKARIVTKNETVKLLRQSKKCKKQRVKPSKIQDTYNSCQIMHRKLCEFIKNQDENLYNQYIESEKQLCGQISQKSAQNPIIGSIEVLRRMFMDPTLQGYCVKYLCGPQLIRELASSTRLKQKKIVMKYLACFIEAALNPQNFDRIKQ